MIAKPSRIPSLLCFFLVTSGLAGELGPGASAEPVHEVVAYAGRFDPIQEDTAEIGWELRLAPRRFHWQPRWLPDLSPIGGVMATSRGALYTYGGFSTRLELSSRWLLTPSLSAGIYAHQNGKSLGGPFEFRSSLEASYVFSDRSRLGFAIHHLSNSRLYSDNPGSESLVVAYVAQLGRRP